MSASETLRPFSYLFSSTALRTVRPLVVGGGGDEFNDHLVADQGLPRQLWLMNEKSLCSILFHFARPRRETVSSKLVSSASLWSSNFHNRTRYPLLPRPPR
jgi:hypothetical protein